MRPWNEIIKEKKGIMVMAEEQYNTFQLWVNNLLHEGYDLSDYTLDEVYNIYERYYGPNEKLPSGKTPSQKNKNKSKKFQQSGEMHGTETGPERADRMRNTFRGAVELRKTQKEKPKKEPYGPGNPAFDLATKREKRKRKQLKFSIEQSKKNAEEKKKQELENIKNKPRQAANAALSDIKTQSISYKDSDATAYTKAIGNVGSLVGGVAKAGIGYAIARNKAKKEAEAIKTDGARKIPKKKPKKSGPLGGRPPGGGSGPGGPPPPPGGSPPPSKNPRGGPTPPARSALGPFATAGLLRKSNSPPRKPYIGNTANIKEKYSNWREELLIEVDETNNKKKKKIIDVLPSNKSNKVELNPNMKEEKDEEGEMAHNELATMERAVKTLRKKIKSPNQQLPAWVQSKISKAADYIDTVSDYMSSETESVTEECGCEDDGKKVLAMMIIKKAVNAKKKKNSQLNSGIIGEAKTAAWQRKEGKNLEGGLNAKGIASYRAQNPGSKLSMAVTTPPSKLKPGSKSANRRKSFCARMGGMPGPMKDEKGRPTRKALSLRKWNC